MLRSSVHWQRVLLAFSVCLFLCESVLSSVSVSSPSCYHSVSPVCVGFMYVVPARHVSPPVVFKVKRVMVHELVCVLVFPVLL